MTNLRELVCKNRNYKKALSLNDFGDKSEFTAYTKAVSKLGDTMLLWAQNDRNDTTEKAIIDGVFEAVRGVLSFFADENFKVKADDKSVRALRDSAIKFRLVYTEEYKKAKKKVKDFADSIAIHLDDLEEKGIVVPRFTTYHDLDAFIEKYADETALLKKAIENYDKKFADLEKIMEGEYAWYEPTLDGNFRNHCEDFIADRINNKLMHEVEDLEARRKARAEKRRAKRAEAKANKAN